MVNSAARELALLVFQLGFKDAADVMARELHATAQTQAALRLRTLTVGRALLPVHSETGPTECTSYNRRLAP